MNEILFKRLTSSAQLPKRATDGAAGFDLYADNMSIIDVQHGQSVLVPTGIAMQIPEGYVGLIKPRSGWSAKFAIDTMAGVIDSDYRDGVQVILTRHEG